MNAIQVLMKEARQIENHLVSLRREFHRFPELSLHESRTAGRVADELRALDLKVTAGIGGHGIAAELQGELYGEDQGRTIAFRADMDGLPITEETGLPFVSENPGVMHACGHDIHTAVLLGTATLLTKYKSALHGTVRFIFQPAEEILSGAKAMIAEGIMNGVDEIYGLHNLPSLPAGKIGVKSGVLMGSIDRIEIRVEGLGGHGGYPEACIDPIVAASAVVMGLQTAVSRETAASSGVVVTIGTFQAGTANNIIPDHVLLTGTVRNLDAQGRETMPGRIERIVQNICTAYRCTGSVAYIRQVPAVDNTEACTNYVSDVSDLIIGKANRITPLPMTYGEDFAEYLKLAKGCFFWLGSGPQEHADQAAGLHSPRFNPDESCMALGAALFAGVARNRLR